MQGQIKMLATAFTGLSLTSSCSLLAGKPSQLQSTHRCPPLQRSVGCPNIEAAHKKGGGSTKNGRCVRRCRSLIGAPRKVDSFIVEGRALFVFRQ